MEKSIMEPLTIEVLSPQGVAPTPSNQKILSGLHNPISSTPHSFCVETKERRIDVPVRFKGFEHIAQNHEPESDSRCVGLWGQIISGNAPSDFFFIIIPNIHEFPTGECGVWFADEPGFTDLYREMRKNWLVAIEALAVS